MKKEDLDAMGLTPVQQRLIEKANTASSGTVASSRVTAELFTANRIEAAARQLREAADDLGQQINLSTNRVIESNGRLARASRAHSWVLAILTGALVLVGGLQVFVTWRATRASPTQVAPVASPALSPVPSATTITGWDTVDGLARPDR
jgi:hypothetical protein